MAPPDLPDLLPGEDRTYGGGLFVDPIPQSSWFRNVRAAVDPADWDRLRHMVYRRARFRCEACGVLGSRERGVWMEAHERFAYDITTGVQRLVRLVCLCQWCHTTTHFGLAQLRGAGTEAIAHLISVTGMSPAEAQAHVCDAFDRWERRSAIPWRVDLSMITAAGIHLLVPQLQAGAASSSPPPPRAEPADEPGEDEGGVLVVATVATYIPASELKRAREPSDAEKALAASYERYADQLAELEALRSGRPAL
jgi:hypothetical protein